MANRNLYNPFEIHLAGVEAWEEQALVYHFFEIVQIQEGRGVRTVNQNRFPYREGNIFLFTPQDCRGFEADTPTRVCSIRFSEVFLSQCRSAEDKARIQDWLKQLEYLFFHHNRHEHLTIRNGKDCQVVTSLINNMVYEYEQRYAFHEANLQHFVTLLLNILARNITTAADPAAATTGPEPLINRIITHIRQHIYYPEKLKLDHMASEFNLSVNYIGEFFKKQTGESIQQYIIQYKLKLVQLRLEFSDLTVSQIADELGFTDESHLSRLFKKRFDISPNGYRKQRLQERRSRTALVGEKP